MRVEISVHTYLIKFVMVIVHSFFPILMKDCSYPKVFMNKIMLEMALFLDLFMFQEIYIYSCSTRRISIIAAFPSFLASLLTRFTCSLGLSRHILIMFRQRHVLWTRIFTDSSFIVVILGDVLHLPVQRSHVPGSLLQLLPDRVQKHKGKAKKDNRIILD